MISRANKPRNVSGFSLVDIPMSISLLSTMLAIAVPAAKDTVDGLRLGMATRDIERELQTARLKAVSANRPLRVRLNCPTVGQFRIIEMTGVGTTDTDGNRCDGDAFPYPGPMDTDRATPDQDGPVRMLHPAVTVSGVDLQFLPNGTTQQITSGAPQPIAAPVSIMLMKDSSYLMVTVNGLGKIQIQ